MQAVGVKPNFYTYCVVLDGLCKSGHVDKALQLLCSLETGGVKLHISMYNIILDRLCTSGRLDSARELFNSLPIKGLNPDVATYSIMINGFCLAGLLKEARECFLKMEKNGCLADSITYNVIVQGHLQGGKYDNAVVYLDKMEKRGLQMFVLEKLSSRLPDALSTVAVASEDRWQVVEAIVVDYDLEIVEADHNYKQCTIEDVPSSTSTVYDFDVHFFLHMLEDNMASSCSKHVICFPLGLPDLAIIVALPVVNLPNGQLLLVNPRAKV
ncbi:hypothetical protein ACH5RR_007176 [Cinchona calisaya]|uniref:Pentatricopeptide repeat-containing protein n=1 Tax=Cinchona calisaya TaxID=153742 RepID=A0ABD3AR39_9GENT